MSGKSEAYLEVSPIIFRDDAVRTGARSLPEEMPVALTFNGSAYAVMMATPSDLEDFAVGFAFTEEVIDSAADIESLEIIPVDGGIEARMWLKKPSAERHLGKRRRVLGPSGCGLCGVESIAEAMKSTAPVTTNLKVSARDLILGMEQLAAGQALNATTRAVHAAGLWRKDKPMLIREDVGRHNGLDKVIGAALRHGEMGQAETVVFLTSRVSVELVQKTARFGAPIIAAVSAPTAFAIRTAEEAGITIAAVVRADGFEVFTYPERIRMGV